MLDPLRLEELMADCARGQEPALARLHSLCAPHLYALAIRMLRRKDLAEDVIQESFVSIWQHAAQYSPAQSQVMTWMSRIVRNRCIDLLRQPQIEVPDPDGMLVEAWADDAPGPLTCLQSTQEGCRLAHCMQQLESRQRMAIVLSFFDGMSHNDIAAQLKAPPGTVKSWIRRGLERMQGSLG